jgi:hypothetical protein
VTSTPARLETPTPVPEPPDPTSAKNDERDNTSDAAAQEQRRPQRGKHPYQHTDPASISLSLSLPVHLVDTPLREFFPGTICRPHFLPARSAFSSFPLGHRSTTLGMRQGRVLGTRPRFCALRKDSSKVLPTSDVGSRHPPRRDPAPTHHGARSGPPRRPPPCERPPRRLLHRERHPCAGGSPP